jgi:hypothetical protein
VLANRYRIVNLLRRGADDLKLGQTVALKFLNAVLLVHVQLAAPGASRVRLTQGTGTHTWSKLQA